MTNLQKRFEKETKIGEFSRKNDPETYWKSFSKWLEERVLELELEKSYTDEERFLEEQNLRGRQGIYG